MSNLERQLEKLYRHCNQSSKGYRIQSLKQTKEFARFIHDRFKVQNFKNISDKHLVDYIQYQQEIKQNTDDTIKNKLSSIRFWHDQVNRPRHTLSDNKTLQEKYGFEFNQTPEIRKEHNRAWTEQEYRNFKNLAEKMGKDYISDAFTISREMGLRISEVTCLERRQVEYASRTGYLPVDRGTKGGKARVVPVTEDKKEVWEVLNRKMKETSRGERLFVEEGEKAHQKTEEIQNFIYNHRSKVETEEGQLLRYYNDSGRNTNMTMHGLRYLYAQERIKNLREEYKSDSKVADVLTQEMGHNRTEVLKTYLSEA
ncbi:integrase [Natranaerobius trueperi]|uniref:Integrase n=2 Tax=Natranaerobius trueperi TaxID=759412 RepID=A0A226BVF5_9FIRM|nr:integrase [Natranaerobius trueperi]